MFPIFSFYILKFTRIDDGDFVFGLSGIGSLGFEALDDVLSLEDFTKQIIATDNPRMMLQRFKISLPDRQINLGWAPLTLATPGPRTWPKSSSSSRFGFLFSLFMLLLKFLCFFLKIIVQKASFRL